MNKIILLTVYVFVRKKSNCVTIRSTKKKKEQKLCCRQLKAKNSLEIKLKQITVNCFVLFAQHLVSSG